MEPKPKLLTPQDWQNILSDSDATIETTLPADILLAKIQQDKVGPFPHERIDEEAFSFSDKARAHFLGKDPDSSGNLGET